MSTKKAILSVFGIFLLIVIVVMAYIVYIFNHWWDPPSPRALTASAEHKTATVVAYRRGCENMCANHPEWVYFSTANSDLKTNVVFDLLIDDTGEIWIATNLGVSRFNHETWQNYPLGRVKEVASAPDGLIWITVYGLGAYVYHNDTWKSVLQEASHNRNRYILKGIME